MESKTVVSFTLEIFLNLRQALVPGLWEEQDNKRSGGDNTHGMTPKQEGVAKGLNEKRIHLRVNS